MRYSKERNKKISDKLKGKPFSEEHKRKLSLAWKKRRLIPISQETRKKLSISGIKAHKNDPTLAQRKAHKGKNNGMYGKGYKLKGEKNGMYDKKHSDETKEKIRKKAIGRKVSEEARQKMSNSQKKRLKDIKERMKYSQPGEINGNWHGGKSFEPYNINWTDILKQSIRQRDNFTCQMPGCRINEEKLKYNLSVHHIDYDKQNCNPINLISLCRKCHSKTNGNRKKWIKFFQKIMYIK